MNTLEVPSDVSAYLAAVRASLADLPAGERDDLLAEVESSLIESASEGGTISARLGAPEEFAAELRSAAGLHVVEVPVSPNRLARLRAMVRAHEAKVAPVRRLASELAPIWWVVRGYLAVGLFAYLLDSSWSSVNRAVPRIGSGEGGLILIAVAIVISVLLGLRTRGRRTSLAPFLIVANLVLLAAAFPIAQTVVDQSERRALLAAAYAPPSPPTPGLAYDGRPIDNVYPYSTDGTLLHDVLLYDGSGRPLAIQRNLESDPNRRVVRDARGRPIFNVFPVRYFEPGTHRVAHPEAAPPVDLPRTNAKPVGGKPRGATGAAAQSARENP